LQVTSDSILTPQLHLLGLGSAARRRPVWGSAIVYELLRRPAPVVPALANANASAPAHPARANTAANASAPPRDASGAAAAHEHAHEYAVLVSYNGVVHDVCGVGLESKLCPLDRFQTKMQALFPSKADCPQFYRNYVDRNTGV
jgi:hypothetical protein